MGGRLSAPKRIALSARVTIDKLYLQHEHYDLWEVIEFGDSYKAPPEETAKDKGLAGKVSSSTKKKGRTMAITAEDMQKRKNDITKSQDRGKRESYKKDPKVEEPAPKEMIAIDGIGCD
nr:hypothetical protein [Tanacetum cinerariifolium]